MNPYCVGDLNLRDSRPSGCWRDTKEFGERLRGMSAQSNILSLNKTAARIEASLPLNPVMQKFHIDAIRFQSDRLSENHGRKDALGRNL